jgi:tRNA(His) 5'-end guanylyltransferase
MPIIIRIDGCHFHTYTKNCKKPVDENVIYCMNQTAEYLCRNIQNCQIAYVQSDEISLLLNNYQTLKASSWFDNQVQKMTSVSAGMASAVFTSLSGRIFGGPVEIATFDSRVFVLPKEEVCNYFIWRQQDATRNSVQMLARSLYKHEDCNNKNTSQLQELCFQKGINWNYCPPSDKRGRCIVKTKKVKTGIQPTTGIEFTAERSEWIVDNIIPIFSEDRSYIEKLI